MRYTRDMPPTTLYELISKIDFTICTDTRKLTPGDIYVGIKGDHFDGNSFATEALDKGASYVITQDPSYQNGNDKIIVVEDTKECLKELAHIHRKQCNFPIIAIGGSNGKTTTKELVSSVLSKKYRVHTTEGNLNNDIGVPLTLLEIKKDLTDIAVIEVGANHPGEHKELIAIVEPTHLLVTNNGADHLEGFGSLEGVRKANTELYDWAKMNGATIFVNKELMDLVQDSTCEKQYLYPDTPWQSTSTLLASLNYNGTPINSLLFGRYNEPNILAAIAIGKYFDISIDAIKEAIETYQPTLKRSQIIKKDSTTIVLDCYNANPTSMEKAIIDFAAHTPAGKRVFVIGDMLEMGEVEKKVHSDIIELLKKTVEPNDQTILVGPRFKILEAKAPFTFFETTEDAQKYFETLFLDEKHILLKASRGIKIEEVIKEKAPL